MNSETQLREQICHFARSLFERGLTPGSSGNISGRLEDGSLIVTPTGSSLGTLDPAALSKLDESGNLISGDAPTKEVPLHSAFYESRARTGAVVHLHSSHAVALSLMSEVEEDNFLPPLTAYGIMKLGKVKLLPFFLPGDPAMGDAIRGLAGRRSAVMLAHHGPVVAGADLASAVHAMEELEETAKLALLTRGCNPILLDATQINGIIERFDVDWS